MARKNFYNRKYKNGYKSISECKVADMLNDNHVVFQYEPMKIDYEWKEEKSYTPDFVLPNGVMLEVKGVLFIEHRKKHLFIKHQYPELDIRFVFDNPNKKLRKNGKMTHADWCERYGFRYCKLSDGIPEEWLDNQYETD